MAKSKKPFHEQVAEKLIEQLKAGTAPWQKPWNPGHPNSIFPMNPTSGKRYKGINAMQLMSQERSDNRWMTYKQAQAVDAQVIKGEKGTLIQYWKFSEERIKLDSNGKPVLDKDGKKVTVTVPLERPRVFFATVFNAEQIDGLAPIQRIEQTWSAVERAENIIDASGATIRHSGQGRAFYRPATDSISLPDKGLFTSADNYYATALHELGHWTGHSSRLDRDLSHPFGSEGYAKEELRAEISSMILGDELGIGHNPEQHVAYVGSWIKVIQEDSMEIFRAAADAEKIQDYLLSFEQKQLQDQAEEQLVEESKQPEIDQVDDVQLQQSTIKQDSSETATADERTKINNVKVAEFRDMTAALERVFNYDKHMVSGVKENEQWEKRAGQCLDNMKMVTCRTAKPADIERRDKIVMSVETYLADRQKISTTSPEVPATKQESGNNPAQEKTFLAVPYSEKNEAKGMGARWDRQQRSWYVPPGTDIAQFSKWSRGNDQQVQTSTRFESEAEITIEDRKYLVVTYGERGAAKAAGAQWDKAAKSWYAGPNADMEKLQRWLPGNVSSEQSPAMNPQEEFTEALQSLDCMVSGAHPIMDGKTHRINVNGDKKGEMAGFYVGHLDGHPAGFIKNNRTGVEIKWKSKGYSLDDQEKTKLRAEAAGKLANRAVERERIQEATAQRVEKQLSDLKPIAESTPYIQSKGIKVHDGALTDKTNQKTYIPAFDADGKQWSMQYIQEDGTKRFAKNSRKEGCFHPVGGFGPLAVASVVVIAEGYATAATLAEAIGQSVVAAFDAGNVLIVAKALHKKYPNKPVIIAGDDDRHLESTKGVNPGREKAEEAAKAVDGKAIFPIFAPGEQTTDPKAYSDFNDLANMSTLGKNGVERQARAAVSKALKEQQDKKIQNQQQEKKQERKRQRTART